MAEIGRCVWIAISADDDGFLKIQVWIFADPVAWIGYSGIDEIEANRIASVRIGVG